MAPKKEPSWVKIPQARRNLRPPNWCSVHEIEALMNEKIDVITNADDTCHGLVC